ncbi:hypothetical protein EIP86_006236 [Pleurotus ostreatoroseus]|nr:hypothetical protein EIP86_006236 [Pleurotus ostreatoroseus]
MLVWTPSPSCHSGYNHRRRSRGLSSFPLSYSFSDFGGYNADATVERAAYEYALAQARVEAARRQREQEEALYQRRLEEQVRRQRAEALRQQWEQERIIHQERQARLRRAHSENTHLFGRPAGWTAFDLEFGFADQAQARAQELRRQREVELSRQQRLQREREEQALRARQAAQLRRAETQRAIAAFLEIFPNIEAQVPAFSPTRVNVDTTSADPASVPITAKKDKGKARETPAIPLPTSKPLVAPNAVASSSTNLPSSKTASRDVKTILERRLLSENEDAEVRETVSKLLNDLFGLSSASETNNVQPSKTVRFEERGRQQHDEVGAHLHRTPAMSPAHAKQLLQGLRKKRSDESLRSTAETASLKSKEDAKSVTPSENVVSSDEDASSDSAPALDEADRKRSLGNIQRIEDSLHDLRSSFVFPDALDFTPSPASSPHVPTAPLPTPVEPETLTSTSEDQDDQLAFTPRNKPIRAYEHALNGLLTQLDAVASGGDAEVRGRRKEVINQVEDALVEMERKVREASRERRQRDAAAAVPEPQQSPVEFIAVALPEPVVVEEPPAAHEELAPTVHLQEQPFEQLDSTIVDVPILESTVASTSLPSEDPLPSSDVSPQEAVEDLTAETLPRVPEPNVSSPSLPGHDEYAVEVEHPSSPLDALSSSTLASSDSTASQPEAPVADTLAGGPSMSMEHVVEDPSAAVEIEATKDTQLSEPTTELVVEDAVAVVEDIQSGEDGPRPASVAAAEELILPVEGQSSLEQVPTVEEVPTAAECDVPKPSSIPPSTLEGVPLDATSVSPSSSGVVEASPSITVSVEVDEDSDPVSHSESQSHAESDAFLMKSLSPSISTSASDSHSATSEDEDLEIIQSHEAEASQQDPSSDTDTWSDVESD